MSGDGTVRLMRASRRVGAASSRGCNIAVEFVVEGESGTTMEWLDDFLDEYAEGVKVGDDGLRADGGTPSAEEAEAAAAARRAERTRRKTPNCVLGGQPIGECVDCGARFDYGRGTDVAIMDPCPECEARDWEVWGYRYNGEEVPHDEAWNATEDTGTGQTESESHD